MRDTVTKTDDVQVYAAAAWSTAIWRVLICGCGLLGIGSVLLAAIFSNGAALRQSWGSALGFAFMLIFAFLVSTAFLLIGFNLTHDTVVLDRKGQTLISKQMLRGKDLGGQYPFGRIEHVALRVHSGKGGRSYQVEVVLNGETAILVPRTIARSRTKVTGWAEEIAAFTGRPLKLT